MAFIVMTISMAFIITAIQVIGIFFIMAITNNLLVTLPFKPGVFGPYISLMFPWVTLIYYNLVAMV